MSASFQIELALRAGNMAKNALELTSCKSPEIARMMLTQVARDLRDIDEFLKKSG